MTKRKIEENKISRLEQEMAEAKTERHRQSCANNIARIKDKMTRMQDLDKEIYYGVWSNISKKFVFGIKAKSQNEAMRQLFAKIGNDARKWRFEIKEYRS